MASMITVLSALAIPAASAFLIPRNHTTRVTVPLTNSGNQMYMAPVRMGDTSDSQKFGFVLSTTSGYTYVAGNNCAGCSNNGSAPTYNPALSATYQPPPANAANGGTVTSSINGKTVVGQLGKENCALQRQDGTWWQYPNQAVLVASTGTDSSAIPGSGIAGLGQSGVPTTTDSLVGQYLAGHPDLNGALTFGLALNSNDGQTNVGSDSSGGALHLFEPDTSLFTGNVGTVPVATTVQQGNFGSIPPQLSSYDWTVQLGGWTFSPPSNGQDVSGGQNTFVTIEPAYPYIKLTAADAQNIYAAIPGAQPYAVPVNAVTSTGVPVVQDANSLSWSVPCATTGFGLKMNLGGVTINVQPSDLFANIGGVCVGNVKGWDNFAASTYIFGSAFLRSAYLVFNANSNPQTNTIGFAARAFASKSSKSEAGPIAGGVVGGIAFLALIGLGAWFYIRRKRQNATPPSAGFTSSGNLAGTEKSHSFFGFGGSKERNDGHLVAEPWMGAGGVAGTESGSHADGAPVVVQPWSPNAPQENAFLSPSGTATTATFPMGVGSPSTGFGGTQFGGTQTGTQTASSYGPGTASPAPTSPGYNAYDRPGMGSGGYSPVPNTAGHNNQAMWVERS